MRGVPMALIASTLALNAIAAEAANTQMLHPTSIMEMMGGQDQVNPHTTRMSAEKLSSSDTFKQALVEEEGIRYTVYRDVAGYPTVGVGHLVLPSDNLQVGDRISHDHAMHLLKQDLQKAEKAVARLVGDLQLYQHEFDALVDLVFNVGEGGVSEHRSPKLNAAIDAGDYDGIAAELDYTAAGGSVANGLIHRSERRAAIFADGNYENPRPA